MSHTELRSEKASLLMRLGKWAVTKRPRIFPADPEEVPDFLGKRTPPREAVLPDRFERSFEVERWSVEGQDCITLHPKKGPGKQHILYFHGGGFVLPIVKEHWYLLGAMVDATGASITAVLYDLVPEHSYANADRLADTAFARISETWDPSDVVLAGDSAGGHMALSLALRQVRSGGPAAGKLVLFAPWLDVTMQNEAMRAIEPHDIMLAVDPLRVLGKVWAEDRDPKSAECSPLFADAADLAKLPPTRIYVGRHDLFVLDCRTFTDQLVDAGVDVRLYEYADAPHVFMALTFTREAKDTIRLLKDFLHRGS